MAKHNVEQEGRSNGEGARDAVIQYQQDRPDILRAVAVRWIPAGCRQTGVPNCST